MLILLQILKFVTALEYGVSKSSQTSMHQPAMVVKLARARRHKFKLSPPSFFTSQHMLDISLEQNIASMLCLLSGFLCLKGDGEGPMLSLLCLHKTTSKYHHHTKSPDHLRPQYESSMVVGFSPASTYKPSLSSTLLRSSHHTFENCTQKSSSFAIRVLS
jgi:hypothetical protein